MSTAKSGVSSWCSLHVLVLGRYSMDTHAGCWQAAWQASTVSAGTIVCRPLLPRESRQHPRFCSHATCALIWHRAPSTHSVLATATCTSNSTSTWKATTAVRCTACTPLFRAIAMTHPHTWQRRRCPASLLLLLFGAHAHAARRNFFLGQRGSIPRPCKAEGWCVPPCVPGCAGMCWRDDAVLPMARVAAD